MATPLELVVALCVVVPPFGLVRVKLTLAPEAGDPLLVTVEVMVTVPGAVNVEPDTDTVAARGGAVITVAFAVCAALAEGVVAFTLTAYVAAAVPLGAPLYIVRLEDCPGLSVTDDAENEVDHPDGSVDPKLMVLAEQPEESLSVTVSP